MPCTAVVPQCERVPAPLVATLKSGVRRMFKQHLQQNPTFGIRQLADFAGEPGIDLQRITTGLRVGSNYRVNRLWRHALWCVVAVEPSVICDVFCVERGQKSLQSG